MYFSAMRFLTGCQRLSTHVAKCHYAYTVVLYCNDLERNLFFHNVVTVVWRPLAEEYIARRSSARGRQTTVIWLKNKSSYIHGCRALTWRQLGFVVLVLVWCKSIQFSRGYARKRLVRFHSQWHARLTFWPKICSPSYLCPGSYLHQFWSFYGSPISNKSKARDVQTDRQMVWVQHLTRPTRTAAYSAKNRGLK